jgi:hypothetical protein
MFEMDAFIDCASMERGAFKVLFWNLTLAFPMSQLPGMMQNSSQSLDASSGKQPHLPPMGIRLIAHYLSTQWSFAWFYICANVSFSVGTCLLGFLFVFSVPFFRSGAIFLFSWCYSADCPTFWVWKCSICSSWACLLCYGNFYGGDCWPLFMTLWPSGARWCGLHLIFYIFFLCMYCLCAVNLSFPSSFCSNVLMPSSGRPMLFE